MQMPIFSDARVSFLKVSFIFLNTCKTLGALNELINGLLMLMTSIPNVNSMPKT